MRNKQMQGNFNILDEIVLNSAMRDRRVHILGVIDLEGALEVQHYLQRIYDLDKEKKVKNKEVTLIINSYGGSVMAGNIILGMIHFLQSEGYKVTGLVQGFAMSMAFDILVACDIRLGYSFSEYMLHQTVIGAHPDALVQQERQLQYTREQWEKCVNMYVEKTNIPRERIEDMYEKSKDWYMLAEEALSLNVIQKILK